jgi:polysaccharide export outer membrane protein
MKNKYLSHYRIELLPVIIGLFLLGSCTPVKHVVYFDNLRKDTTLHTLVTQDMELKIRKNDLLSISVVSPAPDIALFNLSQISSTSSSTGSSNAIGGYLVDNNGNIVIYKLGTIHAEGLTRSELKQKLQKALTPYLNESVVTVRFLNNHVTLIGEFSHPQVLQINNEQIPLLEAIAQSGDLTFTARRDNILVIRESPQGKQFKRLNLSDNSIFYSPFYYLKPDDIVYVEPSKGKLKNTGESQQVFGYILSTVSLLLTILVNFRR